MQWSPFGEVPQQMSDGWKLRTEVRFQVGAWTWLDGAAAGEDGDEDILCCECDVRLFLIGVS